MTNLRSALFAFVFVLVGCREQILHDLDEGHANKLQLILLQSGISVEKVRTGKNWALSVEESEVPRALSVLERRRMMKGNTSRVIQPEAGLLQSSEEKSRAYEQLIAKQTEQTLETIPGVLEARMHLHKENVTLVQRGSSQGNSASVLLVIEPDTQLNLAEIKTLVAGAVGIRAEEVSVLASSFADRDGGAAHREGVPTGNRNFHLGDHPVLSLAGSILILLVLGLWWRKSQRPALHSFRKNEAEPFCSTQLPNEEGEVFRNPFGNKTRQNCETLQEEAC